MIQFFKYNGLIYKFRYAILILLFLTTVILKLHTSSIGIWDKFITEKNQNYSTTKLIGFNRPIRSDEYIAAVPWLLSQSMSADFYPYINKNIRSDGQDMLLLNYNPVFHISIIGKPANWGFLLFGRDYGFSWWWMSRIFLLLVSSFELAMIISNKNRLLSFVSAIWISFSPGVQWWLSQYTTDILYSSQIIICCLFYLINNDSLKRKLLFTGILSIFAINFALSIYPPYQIPMIYLILIFAISFLSRSKLKEVFTVKNIVPLFAAGIIVSGIITSVIIKSFPAIDIMANTIYPGKRFSTGGGYNWSHHFLFLTNLFIPFRNITFFNNSAVGDFISFSIISIPVIIMILIKKLKTCILEYSLITLLSIFLLFNLIYLHFSIPAILAKVTLFSFTHNLILSNLVIGITSVYLSITVFSVLLKNKKINIFVSSIITVISIFLYYLAITTSEMNTYLKSGYLAVILMFFLITCFSFIRGKKILFATLIILYTIFSGLTINPISRGLSSVYDKTLTDKIYEINNNMPGKWAAVNTVSLGNYLVALGVKTFNAVHYYPDLKMWNILDPESKYANIYNRYAHVKLYLTEKSTNFELESGDTFKIYLNYQDIKKANIRYILSRGIINNLILTEKYHSFTDNIYIYEVNGNKP